MNFLGHSYLCIGNEHLIAGNFAGDSYKGNLDKISHLPKHIQDGVKLHRFIDNFTDQSKYIIEAAHLFQANGIAKVAYIACDILLDHYLAKNWNVYSEIEYKKFIQTIYTKTDKNLIYLENDFCFLYEKMKEYKWFLDYPNEKGIETILCQFSKRLRFQNDLDKCMTVFITNKNKFESLFKTFLSEINDSSRHFILENKLNLL